jgi:uncharacterized protein YbjT (DUF2867 family)
MSELSSPALRATLFGGSGMVGIEVLHAALEEPRIAGLAAVGRRPLGVVHRKLTEVGHLDFADCRPLAGLLEQTDLLFHCIGVYQGMVSEAEFYRVTCDYLRALVEEVVRVRPGLRFCLFSAQGANPSSRVLFARAKGLAERILFDSGLDAFAFRPGYIDPGRRRARSRIPVWFARPFYRLFPALGIDAVDLARVMVAVGVGGAERKVFENKDLRRAVAALPGRAAPRGAALTIP